MPMLLSCLQAMPEAQIFLLMSYERAQRVFFKTTFLLDNIYCLCSEVFHVKLLLASFTEES